MVQKIQHNFENLQIWRLAIDIADDVFQLIELFPDIEKYGLRDQISRSSVSISSNVAEGSSGTNTSFLRYLSIALGSSFELQTQLILSFRRNYISEVEFLRVKKKLSQRQRMTITFQKRLDF